MLRPQRTESRGLTVRYPALLFNVMVKYSPTSLDATFSALADPIRRAIVGRLTSGEASVGELARPFKVSLPAISRHLRVLEAAGLLVQERQGRIRRCRLRPRPMTAAAEWIRRHEQFWSKRLDALAEHLEHPGKDQTS